MKKFILSFLYLCILSIGFFSTSYANTDSENGTITVTVGEKIPGLGCSEGAVRSLGNGAGERQYYNCDIQKGAGSVASMLGNIIKYLTFLAGLGGVLFIVINGIMISMSGLNDSSKEDAKKRIIATLAGLTLLMLSGVLLNMIAPWVYK